MLVREEKAPCSKIAFCRSLNSSMRDELCGYCNKSTFAAKTSVTANPRKILMPLQGLCCIEGEGSIIAVLEHGDIVPFPSQAPEQFREPYRMDEAGNISDKVLGPLKLVAVTDSVCASFDQAAVFRFLSSSDFLLAVYTNMFRLFQKAVSYGIEVYRTDAYHAVRHVLKFAKSQDVENLTHAQIAYLTGLGRSTVTEAMHEIALGEPDALL